MEMATAIRLTASTSSHQQMTTAVRVTALRTSRTPFSPEHGASHPPYQEGYEGPWRENQRTWKFWGCNAIRSQIKDGNGIRVSEHGAYSDLIASRYANRKQLPPSAISSQLDNASIKQKPETAIRSLVDCNHKSTPCQLSKEREWRNQNDTTKQGAPK